MAYNRQNISAWKTQTKGDEVKKQSSKYKAEKTVVDDITFDSKKEANRYNELKLLERTNVVKDLRRQVPYVLIEKSKYGRSIRYLADFVYIENGETVVEDCKGVRTPVYLLKKRLMAEKFGILIRET